MDAVFIMIIRLSGVQFGLKTYKWFTKSDDYIAGVQFFFNNYNYRQNWMTQSPVTN